MAKAKEEIKSNELKSQIKVEDEKLAETPAEKESRQRQRLAGPPCYNCKSTNTFVTRTPPLTHPAFLRVRYYKCGNCGENFKT